MAFRMLEGRYTNLIRASKRSSPQEEKAFHTGTAIYKNVDGYFDIWSCYVRCIQCYADNAVKCSTMRSPLSSLINRRLHVSLIEQASSSTLANPLR